MTSWFNGAVAVQRGALLYAVQLEESFTVLKHYAFNSSDYAIVQPRNSTVPWNVALVVDPEDPGGCSGRGWERERVRD